MRKIFLPILFLLFAPLTIFVSLFGLVHTSKSEAPTFVSPSTGMVLGTSLPVELYSAPPPYVGSVSYGVSTGNGSPIMIKQFLEKYNSPIAPYSNTIYEASQRWQIDYRYILAIAQCESNLCKKIPEGSFNCWGFENGDTRFLSWEQAFNQVAKTLKEGYIDQGLITPEQIMPKYAPPSVEKGGPWAKCVSQFMEEME